MLYLIAFLIAVVAVQWVVIVVLWRRTRRIVLGLDEIAEDTLKALYHLSREKPVVRPRDLIRAADLQAERLPMIAAELKRRGWAIAGKDTLQITPPGEKRAIQLIRAHRLWERYLADKEGVALDALHDEAMRREHLITPEEADRLELQLGYPKLDPHGDPIPPRGGTLLRHAEGTPLSQWPERRIGRVVHVEDEPPALLTQLKLMGLTPGAQVEVDERTPGRVLVWSGRQRLALVPAIAERVSVAEALPERMPLSEIEIGQAARIAAIDETSQMREQWQAMGLRAGAEIAALRIDPLGDPVTFRVDGSEIALPRIQANQVLIDALSIREIILPRKPWLVEEFERFKELFARYGSWAVVKRGLVFFGPAFVISVGYMDPGNWGTDIEGGARFGYRLLWIILLANLMAINPMMVNSTLRNP